MSIKIVMYAEGARESLGYVTEDRTKEVLSFLRPGDVIPDDLLGPGHLLIKRSLSYVKHIPEAAISFVEPLRFRGRYAKGSDLLNASILRKLLVWPVEPPDLAVILLDSDGDMGRKSRLKVSVRDLLLSSIVCVAHPEFESWLLSDSEALADVFGKFYQTTANPSSMSPGQAKFHLQQFVEQSNEDLKKVSCDIARLCQLDTLAKNSPSFQELLKDIEQTKC